MRYLPLFRLLSLAALTLLAVAILLTSTHRSGNKPEVGEPALEPSTTEMRVDEPMVLAGAGRITRAKYERIKKGMTLKEVDAILDRASPPSITDPTDAIMAWRNPDDGALIIVCFSSPKDKEGSSSMGRPMKVSGTYFLAGKEDVEHGE